MIQQPVYGARQLQGLRIGVLERVVQFAKGCGRCDVLEVGSYEGGSALAWSHSIAKYFPSGSVMCVDPWRDYLADDPSPHIQQMKRDLNTGDAYSRFLANCKLAAKEAPISHYMGTLEEYVRATGNRSPEFDIVFVDGAHDHKSVLSDLTLGNLLLKEGGIMCGDDLEVQIPDIPQALVQMNAHKDFHNDYHPGVTLAVHQYFRQKVWSEYGFWAIKKTQAGWREPQ